MSLFIYLVYNGNMTEDRNGARLTGAPISLHFVPGGIQNCILKARYIENSLNANGVIIV